MGRCYEFGVEIHPGCEKTMVVSAEGGSCECADCGARCPGRFAGCALVVAVPRRVPTSAPAWARPGAPQPPPPAVPTAERSAVAANGHRGADEAPDLASVQAGLAQVREMLLSLSRRAEQGPVGSSGTLVEAIETLTTRLLDRDERLAAAFLAYGRQQAELGAQIQRLTVTVEGLAAGLAPTLPHALRQILARKT